MRLHTAKTKIGALLSVASISQDIPALLGSYGTVCRPHYNDAIRRSESPFRRFGAPDPPPFKSFTASMGRESDAHRDFSRPSLRRSLAVVFGTSLVALLRRAFLSDLWVSALRRAKALLLRCMGRVRPCRRLQGHCRSPRPQHLRSLLRRPLVGVCNRHLAILDTQLRRRHRQANRARERLCRISTCTWRVRVRRALISGGRPLELAVGILFATLLLFLRPFDARLAASRPSAPLMWCGTMCYSLYLVHWPIAKLLSSAAWSLRMTSWPLTLFVTVPLCALLSILAARAFMSSLNEDLLT